MLGGRDGQEIRRERGHERDFSRPHALHARLHIDLSVGQELDHALVIRLVRVVVERVMKIG